MIWVIGILIFLVVVLGVSNKQNNKEIDSLNLALKSQNAKLEKKTEELLKETDILNYKSGVLEKKDSELEEKKAELEDKISEIKRMHAKVDILELERDKYKKLNEDRGEFLNEFLKGSNLVSFPYIASLIADYKTLDLKKMELSLDWGANVQRQKKVRSLQELRAEEKEIIAEYKTIQYQLDYLIELYPEIEDILSTEYSDIKEKPHADLGEDVDPIRYYMSKEEYDELDECEKNQLALDRYVESHRKSLWQIGRDYELYVGYIYEQHGFEVNYFGSNNGIEDLGRDLIATNGKKTFIIQCKYWSKNKTIHEKHIAQLYGTYISFCVENKKRTDEVTPVFITSTVLSDQAKRFCDFLGVEYRENYEIGDFPRIKCVESDENYTKIYHLPMDLQYDSIRLDRKGRFTVLTVEEAERMGYRRAYKWHGV